MKLEILFSKQINNLYSALLLTAENILSSSNIIFDYKHRILYDEKLHCIRICDNSFISSYYDLITKLPDNIDLNCIINNTIDFYKNIYNSNKNDEIKIGDTIIDQSGHKYVVKDIVNMLDGGLPNKGYIVETLFGKGVVNNIRKQNGNFISKISILDDNIIKLLIKW